MRDTLATQDAVFEAEKILVKNKQKKLSRVITCLQ